MKEINIPRSGATKINIIIFNTPENITELTPEHTMAEPTRPPTRVWDELEGKPSRHVIKFQIIAAITDDAITVRFTTSGLITPLPIVVATLRGNTVKAIKLKKAAKTTAEKGERTLVDTTVAIELAESWKPFMKSKTRIRAIKIYKNVI